MLNSELINDLINPGNTDIKPGLQRMEQILALLNKPQYKYQVIHITGTNGKGSTAAFLESGLVHAGYRVGKFTSPHINRINECICINHEKIGDNELEVIHSKIKKLMLFNDISLSPFEFLTAIMFEYCASIGIDWLILEVGMGGQNDSTNVVNSSYAIITNVELEHTRWLGNTIAEIAKEKSGIIKGGITITADNNPDVLKAIANKTSNFINVLDKYNFTIDLDIQNFRTLLNLDNKLYSLSLFGKFQGYNFLCAYTVFKAMGLPEEHIKYAAENTIWHCRLQLIEKDPLVIVDATHNAAGARSLYDSLVGVYKQNEVVVITSILKDKDIISMLNYLNKLSDSIIYTTIDNNPRGMRANDLAKIGSGIFQHELCIDNPLSALNIAKQMDKKVILITGSLYLLNYFVKIN